MSRIAAFIPARQGVLPLAAALVLFVGIRCAGSTETTREEGSSEKDAKGGLVSKYELLFNPADYNPSVATIQELAKTDTSGRSGDSTVNETAPPETTLGFRIQVLSTTEIDTANEVKNELSNLPESIGIYVIYDSPYYKVRVGDFLFRPDANQLLKTLIDQGYMDSWIVADRILKNPTPRKPVVPSPEKPE